MLLKKCYDNSKLKNEAIALLHLNDFNLDLINNYECL